MNKSDKEKLYIELTHLARRARRFLHGDGPRPDRPPLCGPDGPRPDRPSLCGPDGPRPDRPPLCGSDRPRPDRPPHFGPDGSGRESFHGMHGAPGGPDAPLPEFSTELRGGRPRHPHGHRSPVLSRERILTILLDNENAAAENTGEMEEAQAVHTGTPAGLRQKQLTEAMRINASSMSEFIGRLEDDGYVERSVDPSDKRATLISLTEKGRARACELLDERRDKLDLIFSPLTEEEQKELLRLLKKLQHRGEEKK